MKYFWDNTKIKSTESFLYSKQHYSIMVKEYVKPKIKKEGAKLRKVFSDCTNASGYCSQFVDVSFTIT